MASSTTQPTVGLLLLAALIVAALGTRPSADEAAQSIGKAEGPEADRPDPRTLRDLAGMSVGLETLRQLNALVEAAPAAIETANRSAEQGVAAIGTAADAWRLASTLAKAALPERASPPLDQTVAADLSEDVQEVAQRLGLLQPETIASWADAINGALAQSREAAVATLANLHASLGERALALGDRLAELGAAPIAPGLKLFASAGQVERPAPPTPRNMPLSVELELPSPTGHGGWWSPMGSEFPGFDSGWNDYLSDSMLPHDYGIPHAR